MRVWMTLLYLVLRQEPFDFVGGAQKHIPKINFAVEFGNLCQIIFLQFYKHHPPSKSNAPPLSGPERFPQRP